MQSPPTISNQKFRFLPTRVRTFGAVSKRGLFFEAFFGASLGAVVGDGAGFPMAGDVDVGADFFRQRGEVDELDAVVERGDVKRVAQFGVGGPVGEGAGGVWFSDPDV